MQNLTQNFMQNTAQSRWHDSHQNLKPSVDRRSGFMHDAEAHDILSPKVYVTYIHTQEAFYEGTRGAGGTRSILRGRQWGRRHMKHIYEGTRGQEAHEAFYEGAKGSYISLGIS